MLLKISYIIAIIYSITSTALAQTKKEEINTKTDSITTKKEIDISVTETERIITILASDSLLGRGVKNNGINLATDFIINEYKKIGLSYFDDSTMNGYVQPVSKIELKKGKAYTKLNDSLEVNNNNIIYIAGKSIKWTDCDSSKTPIEYIKNGENVMLRLGEIENKHSKAIIIIDETPEFSHFFKSYKNGYKNPKYAKSKDSLQKEQFVFILTSIPKITSFDISFELEPNEIKLKNLIGIIPGKSRKDEYIIISAHYDNYGIVSINKGDSIANGADENASGVTATLQLAKYFKEKGNNERTIMIVNHGGETIETATSNYLAQKLNAEKIIAMINIDAIGKESAFGPKSAFITGFHKSDVGRFFETESKLYNFTFKPDPYKNLHLYYRCSSTAFGLKGIPAHTFSTVQADRDRYLGGNMVRDDMNTIEVENMNEVIKAIAISSDKLINGEFTPKRITDFSDNPANIKQKKK